MKHNQKLKLCNKRNLHVRYIVCLQFHLEMLLNNYFLFEDLVNIFSVNMCSFAWICAAIKSNFGRETSVDLCQQMSMIFNSMCIAGCTIDIRRNAIWWVCLLLQQVAVQPLPATLQGSPVPRPVSVPNVQQVSVSGSKFQYVRLVSTTAPSQLTARATDPPGICRMVCPSES